MSKIIYILSRLQELLSGTLAALIQGDDHKSLLPLPYHTERLGYCPGSIMDDEVDYDELLADAEQDETFYGDYQDDIEAELAMEAEVRSCCCFVPIRRIAFVVLFLLLYWKAASLV